MSSQHAAQNLQNLVKDQRVDLFIYCIRDRLVDIIRINYELVRKNPHRGKAPILLVVTGLEGIDDMEEWWHESTKSQRRRSVESGEGTFWSQGITLSFLEKRAQERAPS
jgi:hypothetical protein